jgi:hypothetical protein
MVDLVSKAVKDAGCTIVRRTPNDVTVRCLGRSVEVLRPEKALQTLRKRMKAAGFHQFSSALYYGRRHGASTGRDYWFQKFGGSDKAWREYLQTGVFPKGAGERPPGYCGLCDKKVQDYEEHLKSEGHKIRARMPLFPTSKRSGELSRVGTVKLTIR